MSSWIEKVISRAELNGQTIITPFTTLNSCSKIDVRCKCENIKSYVVKDFLRRNCKECGLNLLKITLTSIDEVNLPPLLDNEKWVVTTGGCVSSLGRACNNSGKLLQLDEKYRWHLDGKMQYASIVMAKAFKIDRYETLNTTTNIVRFRDRNSSNVKLNNLYIGTRQDIGLENGVNNKTGTKLSTEDDINDILSKFEYKVLDEFPNYYIFENGSVLSVKSVDPLVGRFLAFSKSITSYKTYYHFLNKNKENTYVHRLVCQAFSPVKGLNKYQDYKDLQVNHKDGNTLNNHKDNLEWVTKSENIQHAYDSNLNKKVQGVLQFEKNDSGNKGNFIKQHKSIASASRETDVPEHEIRAICQGKTKGKREYLWEFVDSEKAKEYSKKFSRQ